MKLLKRIPNNVAIHCPLLNDALCLMITLEYFGFKILPDSYWDTHKSETCYRVNGLKLTYDSFLYFQEENYTIVRYPDFLSEYVSQEEIPLDVFRRLLSFIKAAPGRIVPGSDGTLHVEDRPEAVFKDCPSWLCDFVSHCNRDASVPLRSSLLQIIFFLDFINRRKTKQIQGDAVCD